MTPAPNPSSPDADAAGALRPQGLAAAPSAGRHAGLVPGLVLLALALLGLAAELRLAGTDRSVFLALNAAFNTAAPATDRAWSWVTEAGLASHLLLIVLLLARGTTADERLLVAGLLWSLPIGGLLTHGPKQLLATPRPPAVLPADGFHLVGDALTRFSMPSGHSLTAATVATLVLLLWPRVSTATTPGVAPAAAGPWRAGAVVPGLFVALALLIMASRIAVGAHWPSDVCAGAGLGLLTGLLSAHLASAPGARLPTWLGTLRGQRALTLLQGSMAVVLARDLATGHSNYPLAAGLTALVALATGVAAAARWRAAPRGPGGSGA